jgi:hypothetical protein
LILLAPAKQLGQTVSTRPTFAWFVRDADATPMEFRLYEKQADGFKLIKEIKGDRFRSTPGIMVLSPQTPLPELKVGQRYRWQVELICNANRPSGNLFAESELEVLPLQTGLKTELKQAGDRLDQATLYARANLWYDALGAAINPLENFSKLKELQSSIFGRVALDSTEQSLLQNSPIFPVTP